MASAGGMTAAVLYVCTTSPPSNLGAVPEDVESKKHHLMNGKGFKNPWESWVELSPPKIMGRMIWYFTYSTIRYIATPRPQMLGRGF